MSIKIISVAKHLPKYVRKTKDIIPYVKNWVKGQEERFQRKVIKMFEGAGVDKRYSIMDIDDVFFNSGSVAILIVHYLFNMFNHFS